MEEMKKVTEGVVDVIVYPSAADKTKPGFHQMTHILQWHMLPWLVWHRVTFACDSGKTKKEPGL